nr:hypothetical protein [Tanacetum cinerariifolium]
MSEPTMEEYMTKTQEDYGLGIVRPKFDEKAHFELKGQFLKELCDSTFSGTDNEDANEHIEEVLEIVDLFHILDVTQDQIVGLEGKLVGPYVLKMKGYMEHLEHFGHVLPQDISVALILNGLTSDFARFVRNYNMHNIGKTVGKGKGKEKERKKSYIPKLKNPKPSTKEHPTKYDACHHCKEVGHWKRNCLVYLAELIMKKKQVGTTSSSVSKNDVLYFNAISSNGIYENDMINRVTNVNSIFTISNKRAKHNLDSTYLWHYLHAHISKKRIENLQHDRLLKSTDE